MESLVGGTFGKYEVRRLLGKGGMGEVYEAYDTDRGRTVALKLLTASYADDETFRARISTGIDLSGLPSTSALTVARRRLCAAGHGLVPAECSPGLRLCVVCRGRIRAAGQCFAVSAHCDSRERRLPNPRAG
ncbi:hypothetical protein B8W66_07280 [Mycobacterium decipiens]|uniref:Protein kinase domain-containing protein n=1 Tax=Mycobacterium decipiens TaxID=1430326 RepID=A0A1X2LXM9_9MYCO|nr:hypothetical protein B8W66_07280 [Mycobacterium decipiens]